MDDIMINTGAIVLIAGGLLLLVAGVGFACLLVATIWIAASNRWRAVLRGESLIYEYRKNREAFLRWKKEQT
nr:hypothetical protein [uncultured Dysosmobacter sp.]